jgi:polyferredoxin
MFQKENNSNKKIIIKIIFAFLLGIAVGLGIYFIFSSSISDTVQSALNGIIWLLFIVTGLLSVIIYILMQSVCDKNIVNLDLQNTNCFDKDNSST